MALLWDLFVVCARLSLYNLQSLCLLPIMELVVHLLSADLKSARKQNTSEEALEVPT